MTTGTNPCDRVNLDALLDGEENSELFRRAARHV